MIILDGKKTAQEKNSKLRERIYNIEKCRPSLDIILVGSDAASLKYVTMKNKISHDIGISGNVHHLDEKSTTQEVITLINKLNIDPEINGIMVQLPLPTHLDQSEILNSISPTKDVDGLTSANLGLLFQNSDKAFIPATPKGILSLLKEYNIDISGKNAVIVGRSKIVGIPLSAILLREDATVTICHSKSINLKEITLNADILITAISKPNFFDDSFIKPGTIVVDVSTNIDPISGKIVGDCNYDLIIKNAGCIAPVPGGVGPMTIISLLENTFQAWKLQNKL